MDCFLCICVCVVCFVSKILASLAYRPYHNGVGSTTHTPRVELPLRVCSRNQHSLSDVPRSVQRIFDVKRTTITGTTQNRARSAPTRAFTRLKTRDRTLWPIRCWVLSEILLAV